MPAPSTIAEAFRLLQAGEAAAALEASRSVIAQQPGNARAYLAAGLALRLLGRAGESLSALDEAIRLDPADYGAAYEKGMALSAAGRPDAARPWFERAAQLRPEFAAAHFALGMEAFSRGDWAAAARSLETSAKLDPRDPAALVNLGQAFAESGDTVRAEETLTRAVASFPGFAPARHALGWALHKAGRTTDAIPHLQDAVAAHAEPGWQVDLAKALVDAGRGEEAAAQFEGALAQSPSHLGALVNYGRLCVKQGEFGHAADLFRAAWTAAPDDIELPMYLAQVELLRGRWREGWAAYARREQRLRFEARCISEGAPYRVPDHGELRGARVLVISEQGLGDELFFLRFAPALRDLGARLVYLGDARLRPLLQRTGLFEDVLAFGEAAPVDGARVLCGDLPLLSPEGSIPPSLSIAPHVETLEAMRRRLERAGPRPWIGVTWRAGTPREVLAHALHKVAPIAGLFAALPRDGTVLSLQRDGGFEELESASRALGRPLYDYSAVNADLEEALALVALLDRHVGVSNTNMHLAAAAGAVADVLVPYPPEWRWGIEGESRWFPGFRVYRQLADGDWSRAFASLASAGPGNTSRA